MPTVAPADAVREASSMTQPEEVDDVYAGGGGRRGWRSGPGPAPARVASSTPVELADERAAVAACHLRARAHAGGRSSSGPDRTHLASCTGADRRSLDSSSAVLAAGRRTVPTWRSRVRRTSSGSPDPSPACWASRPGAGARASAHNDDRGDSRARGATPTGPSAPHGSSAVLVRSDRPAPSQVITRPDARGGRTAWYRPRHGVLHEGCP